MLSSSSFFFFCPKTRQAQLSFFSFSFFFFFLTFSFHHQTGLLSVFFSLGSKPLELWNKVVSVEEGEIKKVMDQDIQSSVYELTAPNTLIPKVYLACPADPSKSLGIKLRKRSSSSLLTCCEASSCGIRVAVRTIEWNSDLPSWIEWIEEVTGNVRLIFEKTTEYCSFRGADAEELGLVFVF